jgi:hypothetical protein
MLAFASTVILGSESRETHGHILHSHDSNEIYVCVQTVPESCL